MRILNESLLRRFRGPGVCEWCKKCVRNREAHHVFTRGSGRLDVRINIASLCAAFSGGDCCHARTHNGGTPTFDDLIGIVAAREGVKLHEIVSEVWRLRRIERDPGTILGEQPLPDDPLGG